MPNARTAPCRQGDPALSRFGARGGAGGSRCGRPEPGQRLHEVLRFGSFECQSANGARSTAEEGTGTGRTGEVRRGRGRYRYPLVTAATHVG